MKKEQTKGNTRDKIVKVLILVFLAVGAVLGYSQYIADSNIYIARGAVAFIVLLALERLLQNKV